MPHIDAGPAEYFVTYRQAGIWSSSDDASNKNGFLTADGVASIILNDWRTRDGSSICLYAVCVMSNHVHVVFSTLSGVNLFHVLTAHKGRTSKEINKILGRQGPCWQREYFDKIILPGKLYVAIDYTLQNPVKAGLAGHWAEWPHTYLSPQQEGSF